jgi:hypothetical protein
VLKFPTIVSTTNSWAILMMDSSLSFPKVTRVMFHSYREYKGRRRDRDGYRGGNWGGR